MEIYNLDAALFTRVVELGEINPSDEAKYKGYERVRFASSKTTNLENIVFPEALEDYVDQEGKPVPVVCLAAINHAGVVVGVMELNAKAQPTGQ